MKISVLILLYINYILSFNLYSIIYPVKNSFITIDKKWNWNNKLFPENNKFSIYIGKWYYYNNIDLITENNKLIYQSSTNNSPTIKEILLEFPSCMLESTDFFFNTAEPEKKRNYLNKVLFYVEHSYTDTLKELKKVHKQRNYALKRGLKDEIKLWSNRLCDIEPSITELNQAIIEKLNTKLANSKLTELFYNKNRWIGGIFLKYDNGFDNKKSLNQVLHDGLPLDMLLKRTNYGPHKRKFTIHNKEDNISTFLSRGQQKLLSIILHVLQKEIIDEHTNKSSLLLLDDISSELDSDNLKLMLKRKLIYQSII